MEQFILLVSELYHQYNTTHDVRDYNRIAAIKNEIRDMTNSRIAIEPGDGPVSIYGLTIWIDKIDE